jgi:hypothetical protein
MNNQLPRQLGVPDDVNHQAWNRTYVRTMRISKPGNRLLLSDGNNIIVGGSITAITPDGGAWYQHIGGAMNILYLDMHVDSMRHSEVQSRGWATGSIFGKVE